MMILRNGSCEASFEKVVNGRTTANRIEFRVDGRRYGAVYVTREFGNWWYLFWKTNPNRLTEDEIERMYLRLAIYQDNYDAYSDYSKDMFGFRIRKTEAQWEQMVREERAIYH